MIGQFLIARKLKKSYFWYARLRGRVQSYLYSRRNHKFVFILTPQYCGSTLLTEMMSSSKFVSANNYFGTREGHKLPGVKEIFSKGGSRWNQDYKLDWESVKAIYLKYWDLSRPVLLEKSPPNILRAFDIQKHFDPSFFIVLVRNPYALCESVMRRNKLAPKPAAEKVMYRLMMQKRNLNNLERTMLVKYEDLTEKTENTFGKIIEFIPEIRSMKRQQLYHAHNIKNVKQLRLKNINNRKINSIKPGALRKITAVFSDHEELINYFGYQLIE